MFQLMERGVWRKVEEMGEGGTDTLYPYRHLRYIAEIYPWGRVAEQLLRYEKTRPWMAVRMLRYEWRGAWRIKKSLRFRSATAIYGAAVRVLALRPWVPSNLSGTENLATL